MILSWAGACALACAARSGPSSAPPHVPASAETCERLADHLVELLSEDLRHALLPAETASSHREPLREGCIRHGDEATARCMLEARDLGQAERCGGTLPTSAPPST